MTDRRFGFALAGFTLLALIAIGVIGAIVLLGGDDDEGDTPPATTERAFRSVGIDPPFEKPAVVLTDQDGNPYDLVAETDGNLTLFYFGYTHCPDICPTHMANIAAALKQLPEDVQDRIVVVFATSDPARDTPDVLKDWLGRFNPEFIGLTGSDEQMAEVQNTLGILPPGELTSEPDAEGNYEVAHFGMVLAYGPDDNLGHIGFPDGTSLEVWTHDLTKLAREGYSES